MNRRLAATAFTVLMVLASSPWPAWAQGWTLDLYAGRAEYDAVSANVGTSNGVLGRVSTGLDLGIHGFGYRDPASSTFGAGGTAQGVPFAAVEQGPARFEIHSGLMQYASTFSGRAESRTLHDSGARLIVSGDLPLELGIPGRYARADEGDYPYAGGSASMQQGWGQFWVSLGHWFSEVVGGRVPIRVPVSESATALHVAGDFTAWRPLALVRTGAYWTVSLAVAAGYHSYAFRTEDGHWFVPESMPGRRDDGFGGHVAVLVVP